MRPFFRRLLGFCILFLCAQVLPAEFCAVHVQVILPSGTVGGSHRVSLFQGAKLVKSAMTVEGRLSFCDFGLGEHSIVLEGDRGCYDTVVSRIFLTARHEQRISISGNVCFFHGVYSMPPSCNILLKIQNWSELSKLASSLRLRVADANMKLVEFDSFGRVQDVLRKGQTQAYEVMHNEKVIQIERVACERVADVIQMFHVAIP
jgi:hypothetical protein